MFSVAGYTNAHTHTNHAQRSLSDSDDASEAHVFGRRLASEARPEARTGSYIRIIYRTRIERFSELTDARTRIVLLPRHTYIPTSFHVTVASHHVISRLCRTTAPSHVRYPLLTPVNVRHLLHHRMNQRPAHSASSATKPKTQARKSHLTTLDHSERNTKSFFSFISSQKKKREKVLFRVTAISLGTWSCFGNRDPRTSAFPTRGGSSSGTRGCFACMRVCLGGNSLGRGAPLCFGGTGWIFGFTWRTRGGRTTVMRHGDGDGDTTRRRTSHHRPTAFFHKRHKE